MASPQQRIATAALFLSASIFISKIFGFIKMMLIAKYFGTSPEFDAYNIAISVPTFTASLLTYGVITSIVPVFTEYLSKDKEYQGWLLLKKLIKILLPTLIIITILGIYFSSHIVRVLAPGFDKDTHRLATNLTSIAMPYFLFQQIGGFLQAILQSYQLFTLIIIWQLIPNLILIIALIIFTPYYGIYALTVGFLLTGIAYCMILLPGIIKIRLSLPPYPLSLPPYPSDGLAKIAKMFLPIALSGITYELIMVVNRALASYVGEGAISIFTYAFTLYQLPYSIFISMTTLITLPIFSTHYQRDLTKFKEILIRWLKFILYFLLPIVTFLFVLNLPITRVIYERGEFSIQTTYEVAQVMRYFSFALIGYGLFSILLNIFYSIQNSRIPLYMNILFAIITIILSIILVKIYKIVGLALSFSIAGIITCLVAYYLLKYYIKLELKQEAYLSIIKMSIAAILTGILLYFILPYFETPNLLASLEKRVFALLSMFTLATGMYIFLSYLFKIKELELITKDLIYLTFKKLARIVEE